MPEPESGPLYCRADYHAQRVAALEQLIRDVHHYIEVPHTKDAKKRRREERKSELDQYTKELRQALSIRMLHHALDEGMPLAPSKGIISYREFHDRVAQGGHLFDPMDFNWDRLVGLTHTATATDDALLLRFATRYGVVVYRHAIERVGNGGTSEFRLEPERFYAVLHRLPDQDGGQALDAFLAQQRRGEERQRGEMKIIPISLETLCPNANQSHLVPTEQALLALITPRASLIPTKRHLNKQPPSQKTAADT